MTKEEYLNYMDNFKNIWTTMYDVGGKYLKDKYGKKVLLLQSTTGGVIIDTAKGETLDVQMVGFAGDLVGGFVASLTLFGFYINLAATLSGNSLGDHAKRLYKDLKINSEGQYYTYHKNFSYSVGGSIVTCKYAKILRYRNGDAVFDNGIRAPYVQEISEYEYKTHVDIVNKLNNYVNSEVLDTKIEMINNSLIMKIHDGTTYIKPYNTSISTKLIGTDLDDVIASSTNKDILIGGNGFDIYYAGDKDEIIDSDGKGQVIFNGYTLKGGSYDEDRKVYIDAKDTSITYELKDNNDLIVTKGNSSITIRNFKKSKDGFLNINLKDNPGKEVTIVIDTTGSMGDDIATCKANAKIIASNIFKENFYSKISIVTYNDNDIKTIGTYTDYQGFLGGINSVNLQYGGTEYTMAAILEGMSNFSPHNHLSKEVYVMTDENGDDNHRRDEVERKAKNLSVGFRSIYNANKYEDNSVKINFIAIRNEFEHFKDLAKNTNGMYFNSNSSEELSDALFELSNIGTSSNDTIEGNDKDNSLNGFGGDDTLVGKAGSDTYTFTGLNFGNDTIIESNLNNIDKNTIIFKDVSYKDVRFKKDLNDLKITLNKDNSVTIKDFYNTNNESKISSISFSDVTLDELAIKRSVSMQANKEAIVFLKEKDFSFSNFATSTFAVAYQDNASNISTSYKDDVIIGSNKNDVISTKLGNDTLIGGKGDDKLYGGFGNDIYVYRKGDGNDLIYDDGGQDALKLQNLKADEIFLIKDGKDLLIKFKDDDTNSIRVAHHFAWKFGYHNQINTIELDDNKFINTKTIDKLIEQTSAFAKNNGIDIHNINHINDDRLNQIYMSAWN